MKISLRASLQFICVPALCFACAGTDEDPSETNVAGAGTGQAGTGAGIAGEGATDAAGAPGLAGASGVTAGAAGQGGVDDTGGAGMSGAGGLGRSSLKPDVDPTTPTTTAALCSGETSVTLYNDSNYTFSNELVLSHAVVKDATDLTFDWSGVTRDMFGTELNPATELGSVLVSLWPLSPAEIAEALKEDDLSTALAKGAITAYPDGTFTSENLLNFSVFGEELPEEKVWNWFDTSLPDYMFPQDSHTFLLSVSGGTVAVKDQRMLKTFTLDPAATETTVALDADSTTVNYEVDLLSPVAVQVPTDNPDVKLDWRGITHTALGKELRDTNVSEVIVAHYDMTREQLEENFLRLRGLSLGEWRSEDIAGSSIQLSNLTDDAGEAFTGITADGLWLLAMFCTVSCNNPAPVAIAFLEPCP